jgi:hypothetical protein
MPKCINDNTKKYTGNENTPLGLGYSSSVETVGTIMKGKDDKIYIVKLTKNSNRWVNFDDKKLDIFNNLDSTFYRPTYYPKFRKIDKNEETGIEEKMGGSFPFFIEGETWPENNDYSLCFFGQFKDPREESTLLYRIFVPIFDPEAFMYKDNSYISVIDLNEENLSKQIRIENPLFDDDDDIKPYDPYKIISWTNSKELIEYENILKKLNIIDKKELLYDIYSNNIYYPSSGIKIGGTSVFCQYCNNEKKYENFFQMSECSELPYEWGDAGIAHIYKESDSEKYYLEYDCY